MKVITSVGLLGILACAPVATSPAGAAPHTPAKGSSEREAIMNALRRVVGPNFRKRVVFTPQKLRVERGWAYFDGGSQFADGTTVNEVLGDEAQAYAGGGVRGDFAQRPRRLEGQNLRVSERYGNARTDGQVSPGAARAFQIADGGA